MQTSLPLRPHRCGFASNLGGLGRLGVLSLALSIASPVVSQEFASQDLVSQDSHARPAQRSIDQPAADQPCVLLKNGSVLFGTTTTIGDTVCVSRADASKVNLSVHQVEAVGRSLRDLYEHRKKTRFEGDVKRCQADVRWCLRNGLVHEAAEDILHARSLDPSDSQTVQLLRVVAARMKQESGQPLKPANSDSASAIRKVSYEAVGHPKRFPPVSTEPSDDAIGLPEQAVIDFANKVQPVLLNRCATCHHREDQGGTGFRLHSSSQLKWAPKIVTRDNLKSVLDYVDRNDPSKSILRARAIDGHGGRRHGFAGSGSAMLSNLDRWLENVAAAETPTGHSTPWQEALDDHVAEEASLERSDPPELSPVFDRSRDDQNERIPELPDPIRGTAPVWGESEPSRAGVGKMRRMPKVENPFDPEIFNRRVHGR